MGSYWPAVAVFFLIFQNAINIIFSLYINVCVITICGLAFLYNNAGQRSKQILVYERSGGKSILQAQTKQNSSRFLEKVRLRRND